MHACSPTRTTVYDYLAKKSSSRASTVASTDVADNASNSVGATLGPAFFESDVAPSLGICWSCMQGLLASQGPLDKSKSEFEVGDYVKVISGSYIGLIGKVTSISGTSYNVTFGPGKTSSYVFASLKPAVRRSAELNIADIVCLSPSYDRFAVTFDV